MGHTKTASMLDSAGGRLYTCPGTVFINACRNASYKCLSKYFSQCFIHSFSPFPETSEPSAYQAPSFPAHPLPRAQLASPLDVLKSKSTHVRKKSHPLQFFINPLQFFINPTSLNECKAESFQAQPFSKERSGQSS